MRKAFFILLVCFIYFFLPGPSHATNSFKTEIDSTYEIKENYSASVRHSITLENLTEFTYAPFFTLELEGKSEDIQVKDTNGDPIRYEVVEEEKRKVRVIFTDKNAGRGNVREFTISYSAEGVAQEKGQLKEIYIPGTSSDSRVSKRAIVIRPPLPWGTPSITKPSTHKNIDRNAFLFDKITDLQGGVLMVFGEEQFYEVNLAYNLKNPNIFPAEREIALPPTTSYQDVVIKEIEPYPNEIKIDGDGNWLASYLIEPSESISIHAKLFVRTHMGEAEFLSDSRKKKYTKNDHYWEIHSTEIKQLSTQLSDARSISDFVTDTLLYDYSKKSSDKKRYGARESLENTNKAVCLEYADLFIALARAKNIPARSIEGYAYSDNPSTRPLSLVKDILHAWPEYYDEKTSSWKMIDPTWIDTTGGLDYFNTFDFDHIAFVIKGSSSRYPIPAGAYKLDESAKDIDVTLLQKSEFTQKQQLVLIPHARPAHFTLMPLYVDVTVRNSGDTAFNSGEIVFSSNSLKSDAQARFKDLAPGEEEDLRVRLMPKSFLTKGNATITMRFGGQISLLYIDLVPYPPIPWIIAGGLFSVTAVGCIIFARKSGYLHVPRFKRNNSIRRES